MPRSFDIWLWDETWYLHNGISDSRNFFYFGDSYENAPLYSSFYTIVHCLWSNPIYTYFYGGVIVIVLFVVMSFFAFLVISSSLTFSLACVGILTIGNAADVWPRVSLAAIALISATLVSARLCKSLFSAAAIMMVGAFLTAFIRSEFVVSLYILIVLTGIIAISKVINFRSASFSLADTPALFAIVSLLGLAVVWSFPVLHLSAKGFTAFGQHFALRAVAYQGSGTNPWVNWNRITQQAFPGAGSVVSAFIINPRELARFLFENAAGTFRAAISTYLMPITPWRGFSRITLLVVYVTLGYQVLRGCRLRLSRARAFSELDKMTVFGILTFIVPVAVSCIIVYPRSHYLVILVFLVLMLICTLPGLLILEEHPFNLAAVSCVLLWFTPALHAINQPNLEIIRKLRDIPNISRMVEIDRGWCTYLAQPCETIFAYDLDKVIDLKSYFKKKGVDTIFVSKELLRYTPVFENPQFVNIVEDPVANGWTVETLDSNNYLLIRARI
jgi:hypothetical protein